MIKQRATGVMVLCESGEKAGQIIQGVVDCIQGCDLNSNASRTS